MFSNKLLYIAAYTLITKFVSRRLKHNRGEVEIQAFPPSKIKKFLVCLNMMLAESPALRRYKSTCVHYHYVSTGFVALLKAVPTCASTSSRARELLSPSLRCNQRLLPVWSLSQLAASGSGTTRSGQRYWCRCLLLSHPECPKMSFLLHTNLF